MKNFVAIDFEEDQIRLQKEREKYERHKKIMREKSRESSNAGRDIAPIPDCAHPEDKERARNDFKYFCERYFPASFTIAWSDDHLKVISKIETAVTEGGMFAVAMPRGSGKTTLCETACIWAAVYGYHDFILIVGCESDAAASMFNSIKAEFVSNELLQEDFPEVCYPIDKLEGSANRASGQHVNGKRTFIKFNSDIVILPVVEESDASGCVIKYAGITGRIRGMKQKREFDTKNARPTLVIIDDPQTDESARSPKQISDRMKVVTKTILNLPGAGQSISAICPCTVIEKGDLADRMLDRKENPEWQGERLKALYSFPENMELWNEYSDIRNRDLEEDGDGSVATEFYKAHREEMDKGAIVAWKERYTKKEISGLQYLMNKYFENEAAFQSEFQQEPLVENVNGDQLTAGHIFDKMNGRPRFEVPLYTDRLTAFIDVQQRALFYVVCAWSEDFSGAIIDYGTYPKQYKRYFSLQDLSPSLDELYPKLSMESRLRKGLEEITEIVLGRAYKREDNVDMFVKKCYIDANWGNSTDIVYTFCRESKFNYILTPSHGKYFGAKDKPIIYRKRQQGETVGYNWYYPNSSKSRAVRHIIYDTNCFKTLVFNRFITAQGGSGSLTLFGDDRREHELFVDHMCSEFWTPTEGHDRVVHEWALKPNMKENHWWDGVVGCAVGASELGCSRPEFHMDKRYSNKTFNFKSAAEGADNSDSSSENRNKNSISFASFFNE